MDSVDILRGERVNVTRKLNGWSSPEVCGEARGDVADETEGMTAETRWNGMKTD